MSDERDNQRSGKARQAVKGTGKIVFLPFRTGWKAGKNWKKQVDEARQYGESVFSEAGGQARDNLQQASRRGANHQFAEIFGGPDGFEMLQKNLRRFLSKKRWALGLMAFFTVYGMTSVIVYQQFFGLLGMTGAVMLGLTLALESQFRLWQLRNHRLSREEHGSFTAFWQEEPIWKVINPELKSPLLAVFNAPRKLLHKLGGGRRHG